MAKKSLEELSQKKHSIWKAHIRAWGKSGLTQNEYCRRNSLKPHQFTYWKSKYYKNNSSQVSFVSLPMTVSQTAGPIESKDSGLSVQLGKVEIRLNSNFNPGCFVKVVSLLEERL